jgi:hypothetical protein
MVTRSSFLRPSGIAGPKQTGIPVTYTDIWPVQERTIYMSNALWCDKGEHAFSAKDPEKQHFTKTQTVQVLTGNSYGNPTYQPRQEITEELDICGPCWKSGNDFSAKQINGPKKPTLEDLERDDNPYEAYEKGYAEGRRIAEEKFYNTHPVNEQEIMADE